MNDLNVGDRVYYIEDDQLYALVVVDEWQGDLYGVQCLNLAASLNADILFHEVPRYEVARILSEGVPTITLAEADAMR